MRYSQDALDEMADQVDLLDYASHTVDFVKHSGNTHYAVCPFHNEKTASLAVNTDGNYFHCFGCGKSGKIYQWIQWIENKTFTEAVEKVADITHNDICNFVESETVAFYKTLKKLSQPIKEIEVERTYLDIEKDYKEKFEDTAPQEWIDEGISEAELKKYEIRIDRASNRIVYPVYDNELRMIGVKGRTRFTNFKDLNIPKYMNYYPVSIGDYFACMKQAKEYVSSSGEIIIVEGIKSVMKLDQWGFHNTVSAETSSINEYQIQLLLQMHVENIVIAFDKDVPLKKIRESIGILPKFTNVFVIIDKWKLLEEKDSPCDKGEKVFRELYRDKIKL